MGIADYVILAVIAACAILAWRTWRKTGSCNCSTGGCTGNCASCKGKCDCAGKCDCNGK